MLVPQLLFLLIHVCYYTCFQCGYTSGTSPAGTGDPITGIVPLQQTGDVCCGSYWHKWALWFWYLRLGLLFSKCKQSDSFVQDCSNSRVLAMELLQSCTKPSKWSLLFSVNVSVFKKVYMFFMYVMMSWHGNAFSIIGSHLWSLLLILINFSLHMDK